MAHLHCTRQYVLV